MPDPDPVHPEIIEFSPGRSERPAHPVKSRLLIAGAAAAVIIIAVVVVFAGFKPGGSASASVAAGRANPALARLIAQVTSVPVSTSDAAGDGGGQVTGTPARVTGKPLTAGGKPEVFFVGEEFCPYCATERWAIIVALSRFGTFTGLSTIRSDKYPPFPSLDTWTFYRSAYSSKYLAFIPVETRSNIPTSHNTQSTPSYTTLQKLTPAQQAIFTKYERSNAVPFLDFGNKYVLVGSSFSPGVLVDKTWSQIAAALRQPRSATGQAILGTANYVTAEICALTGDQPASACTATVRSLPDQGVSTGGASNIVFSLPTAGAE
jgi:Domain of unknown function (DUF929)